MTDLQVGAKAPDFNFSTISDTGNNGKSFKGVPFVVFFYPRAGTPACTDEVLEFSRQRPAFERMGVKVVGVSPDGAVKLAKFAAKHEAAVDLVADPDLAIIQRWGVWVEKSMYGRSFMGVERATFLVDAKGEVARLWRKVKVAGHVDAVLAAAAAMTGSDGETA